MRAHRLAMVTSSGGTWSASTTNTVVGGGSSNVLSSAGPASWTRWKSTITSTRRRPSTGLSEARRPIWRASSTVMYGPVRSCTTTSGWTPPSARRHSSHTPQPPAGHSRAAAKERAASRIPAPGGPTSR
jgi:hypothetical protein